MRVWLPFEPELLDHVPDGIDVEVFSRTDEPPPTITDVEFYVPDYEFAPITVEVIEQMSGLRLVQTLTAGVDASCRTCPTASRCAARAGSTTRPPRSWPSA